MKPYTRYVAEIHTSNEFRLQLSLHFVNKYSMVELAWYVGIRNDLIIKITAV
jgi:hypothetical protein